MLPFSRLLRAFITGTLSSCKAQGIGVIEDAWKQYFIFHIGQVLWHFSVSFGSVSCSFPPCTLRWGRVAGASEGAAASLCLQSSGIKQCFYAMFNLIGINDGFFFGWHVATFVASIVLFLCSRLQAVGMLLL